MGDDKIDVLTAFMKTFENEHTGLFPNQAKTTMVNSVVKNEITRNIGRIQIPPFVIRRFHVSEVVMSG